MDRDAYITGTGSVEYYEEGSAAVTSCYRTWIGWVDSTDSRPVNKCKYIWYGWVMKGDDQTHAATDTSACWCRWTKAVASFHTTHGSLRSRGLDVRLVEGD